MDAVSKRERKRHISPTRIADRQLDTLPDRAHASLHRLRLYTAAARHTLCRASREYELERTGDVAAQACGVPLHARHRLLLDAVDQAARGARVPPRGAVQQPQRGRGEVPQLSDWSAELYHRTDLHAAMDDGGRCHDERDAGLVVRPWQTATFLAGVSCHGQHSRPLPQYRQDLQRLLSRLYPRPLSAGLPDGGAWQPARRSHYGQRHGGTGSAPSVDDCVGELAHEAPLRIFYP